MQSLFTLEELHLDYPKIYGIATPVRHLRLGYLLNKHPDFSVEMSEDILDYEKKSRHSAYLMASLDLKLNYLLIKNKCESGLFYKKYKNIDYLLCALTEEEVDLEIIKKISKLTEISICFALDTPSQKDILNFTQLL